MSERGERSNSERRRKRRRRGRSAGPAPSGHADAAQRTPPGDEADSPSPILKPGAPKPGVPKPGQHRVPKPGSHWGRKPRRGSRLRTVHETSAGGLVIDGIDGPPSEQVAALIGRTDRRGRLLWSLPKGHIEVGETAEETAVREVAEETGVRGRILAALGSIDYWFVTEGRRVHKTVHHYLLRFSGGELCDDDVEVSSVEWVPLHELPKRLAYADERRLARVASDLINTLQAHGPTALPPLPVVTRWRNPQTHSRTRDRDRRGSRDRKNGRGLDR